MFHVPEAARWHAAPDAYASSEDYGNNGMFRLESPEPGWLLVTVASDGDGWEHVSVHAIRPHRNRTPTWKEMAYIKQLFWDDDDVVVQIYPKQVDYVNCHPHTLHWWRPVGVELPTPPRMMV